MIDEVIAGFRSVNRSWSQVTTGLLQAQWACVEAGFRTADTLLGAAAQKGHEGPGDLDALVRCSLERVGMGKPPPRELYDVSYREQIDWLRFPAWARPSDPEAFAGCAHEG
jgi:hypothetical protein